MRKDITSIKLYMVVEPFVDLVIHTEGKQMAYYYYGRSLKQIDVISEVIASAVAEGNGTLRPFRGNALGWVWETSDEQIAETDT